MEVIRTISQALRNVLGSYFNSDTDVMSEEAKNIFSNKEDRKTYIEAVEKLRNSSDEKEVTIKLSNDETMTLVS